MPVTDTDILDWKDDFLSTDTNTPTDAQNISAELDDEFRNIKSVIKEWSEDKRWVKVKSGDMVYDITLTVMDTPGIRISGGDYTDRFSRGQMVKVDFTIDAVQKTIFFVVTNVAYSSSQNETRIELAPTPRRLAVTWDNLAGNNLTAAAGASTDLVDEIFGTELGSNSKAIIFRLASAYLCSAVGGFVSSGVISVGNSVKAGLSSAGDILATWYVDLQSGGAIHETLSAVSVVPDAVYVSAATLPVLHQSGSAIITGTNSAGPYALSNLPRAEIDTSYLALLQVTGTSIASPSNDQLRCFVSARTTTNFSVSFGASIPAGETVNLDWLIHR